MPNVRFVHEDISVRVKEGTTIAIAARKAGVFLETPCNGAGTCGKCKIRTADLSAVQCFHGPKQLTEEEQNAGILLACHTRILKDVELLTLQKEEKNNTLSILSEGHKRKVIPHPCICKDFSGSSTKVYEGMEILGTEEGDTTDRPFVGVTVDIGTTTLVAALVDLYTGEELATKSALNPQCKYAQDVVSRIQYCSEYPEGLETLFREVSGVIHQMILDLCHQAGCDPQYIYEAVYSGNTVMLHLATDTDPYSLGQYPYTSVIRGNEYRSAASCGLQLSPFARVYLPPVISSYVGADIVSGILSCALEQEKKKSLFIDIGTNGEMVLAVNGHMTATSTAAGPAFEGMNIQFGMRADQGAIEGVMIGPDGAVQVSTIGGKEAVGICGSGLFDLVAELYRVGIIEKNGRLAKPDSPLVLPALRRRLAKYNGKAAFQVTEHVFLTQLDIRQVQLAKSAIRAGMEAMLSMNGISPEELDQVLIAGSFGYHIRTASLIRIGILPGAVQDRVVFVGNTSKTGGTGFLLDAGWRNAMEGTVRKIQAIDLSSCPDFEPMFIQYMNMP